MKKLKVQTVVGTRPELIRLSRVIDILDQNCDHVLVHTGQNFDFELNKIFFDDLGIRLPDYFLDCGMGSASSAASIGNIIISVDEILRNEEPDAVLLLGDTNSSLSAIAAKRRKIPIFHMEAGNRCFDMRVPEEINRKIVDHIADINLPYSAIAREYLISEGLPPAQIIKTGSPMFEVLEHNKKSIEESKILTKLDLEPKNFFVVSAHREENIDPAEQFFKLVEILNFLGETFGKPVLLSTHPRTRKMIERRAPKFHKAIRLIKPLGFFDYLKLQLNSKAVLSDSGTINEEATILNFPALNIRQTHERPEAMEEGGVIMVGLSKESVAQGLEVLAKASSSECLVKKIPTDYKVDNVSEKILRIIMSYTGYVNEYVWRKSE